MISDGVDAEQVWSDSVFWLSENTCRNLIKWYTNNSPISSELDAYAHFLPCLGTDMKDANPSNFKDFRSEMLPIFKDCSLKVLLLQHSKFYHLGTMEEYLEHFTCKGDFISELGLLKNTSNKENPFMSKNSCTPMTSMPDKVMMIETYFASPDVRITLESEESLLVLEYCQIYMPCFTKGNIIVNNCILKKCPTITFKFDRADLFDNLLYHTVPIRSTQLQYVTIAFDLAASMKKSYKNLSDVSYLGCSLDEVIQVLGYKESEVRGGSELVSLWTAKLFKGACSPEESFWLTHNAVNMIRSHQDKIAIQTDITGCNKSVSFFSMKDIVEYKDLDTFMAERLNLSSLL